MEHGAVARPALAATTNYKPAEPWTRARKLRGLFSKEAATTITQAWSTTRSRGAPDLGLRAPASAMALAASGFQLPRGRTCCLITMTQSSARSI